MIKINIDDYINKLEEARLMLKLYDCETNVVHITNAYLLIIYTINNSYTVYISFNEDVAEIRADSILFKKYSPIKKENYECINKIIEDLFKVMDVI